MDYVETLELFEQLLALRRNLQSKAGFDRAAKQVLSWAGEEALPTTPETSRGGAVATDRKLSDFGRLTGRAAGAEAAADDLIRQLVGPFIEPARDQRQDALVPRVDEALSAAMRRVLHSPEFQTAEALWRSLDLLVRRIETGAKMQIVLYDISAEELAADLAASGPLPLPLLPRPAAMRCCVLSSRARAWRRRCRPRPIRRARCARSARCSAP